MCIALFSESPRAWQLAGRLGLCCVAAAVLDAQVGAAAGGGTWLPQPVLDGSSSAAGAGCELGCAALCGDIFVGNKVCSGFCRAAITKVPESSCCL